MKIWIKTEASKIEKRTDGTYVAGEKVPFSRLSIDVATCLLRISGTPAQISAIESDTTITVLTDDEAQVIIKSKYPDSDLENVDTSDSEVDEIAKAQGLDPKIRADIVVPTKGKQLLQDQENYLLTHISEKIGLTQDYWDTEASKTTKWTKGIDIEHDIKDGKAEAHSFVLDRIRTKILATKIAETK